MIRIGVLNEKARKLDRLPPYFKETVDISDLVATYDCLAQAPELLWREFADLSYFQLTEQTTRRYREMGSHYRALKSLNYVRWGIGAAVVAGLGPLMLFLIEGGAGNLFPSV